MPAGLLIRLRPAGPWRIGPDSGDRDRVDRIYHSDSLYSAVSSRHGSPGHAGRMAGCHGACRRAGRAIQLVLSRTRAIRCWWCRRAICGRRRRRPRFAGKARDSFRWAWWNRWLRARRLSEDGWTIDGPSECLLPFSTPPSPGPFRVSVRSSAAVDRDGAGGLAAFDGVSGIHARQRIVVRVSLLRTTLRASSGLQPLTAAFRLLAIPDSAASGRRAGAARKCPRSREGLGELHVKDRCASGLLAAVAVSSRCRRYGGLVAGQLFADHPRRARRKRRALGRSQEADAHGGGRLGAGGLG